MDLIEVPIDAEIEHGKPLYVSGAVARIPPEAIEEHEIVYRVRRTTDMAERGDLLIVERRSTEATGELVVAFRGPNAFLGHWWAKHGLHELHVSREEAITGELLIAGVVTLIVRPNDKARGIPEGKRDKARASRGAFGVLPSASPSYPHGQDGTIAEMHQGDCGGVPPPYRRTGDSLGPFRPGMTGSRRLDAIGSVFGGAGLLRGTCRVRTAGELACAEA
jgi:hypothetical protein